MLTLAIQTILLVVALFALWGLWRSTASRDRRIAWIVGIGLAIRTLSGAGLFFVSYYEIPFAESHQLGGGLWFFARDATVYYPTAEDAAREGLDAIVHLRRGLPSVHYIQALSLFIFLFGDTPAVSLLLNLFGYLGICWLMVHWGMVRNPVGSGLLVALAAVAFSPTWILWSTQPLKDGLFIFLTVLLFWSLSVWLRSSGFGSALSYRGLSVATGVMFLALYLIAGIRWYFAVFLLGAGALLMLQVVVRLRGHRVALTALSLVVLVVSSGLVVAGSGPYMPAPVRRILTRGPAAVMDLRIASQLHRSRRGFQRARGGTQIEPAMPGPALLGEGRSESGDSPIRRGTSLAESKAAGLARGALALVVPREIGMRLGWFRIGGGRGLWAFAELDTIYFDLVVLSVIILCWAARSRFLFTDPMWVTLVAVMIAVGLPLVYVVTNFGTLFRLREMIFVEIMLIPLVVDQVKGRRPASVESGEGLSSA